MGNKQSISSTCASNSASRAAIINKNTNNSSSSSSSGNYVDVERKKAWILERQKDFPTRLRIAIDKANNNNNSNSNSNNTKAFLSEIQKEFEEWLFENNNNNNNSNTNTTSTISIEEGTVIRGLNDQVDTEEQVELALRCFPQVLTQRLGRGRFNTAGGLYPIFWLSQSIHSVSFIPLFAELGVELGLFQDFERGGLVFGGGTNSDMNVFCQLAAGTTTITTNTHTNTHTNTTRRHDEEYQSLVDEKFLAVIQRLRRTNLMQQTDIVRNNLLGILNHQAVFPELRFRYFVDWDPRNTLLLMIPNTKKNTTRGETKRSSSSSGKALSLKLVARYIRNNNMNHNNNKSNKNNKNKNKNNSKNGDIDADDVDDIDDDTTGLQMIFELGMKYYPTETGFMFHKYNIKKTNSNNNSTARGGATTTATTTRRGKDSVIIGGGGSSSIQVPPPSPRSDTVSTTTTTSTTKLAAAKAARTTTTPYRIACEKYGIERVNQIIQNGFDDHDNNNNNNSKATATATATTTTTATRTTALIHAASNANVDMECLYILLQRDPTLCKTNK